MNAYLIYIVKSALILAALFLFFKLLLSRDTFHRFNRIALLSLLVISTTLPAIRISMDQENALSEMFAYMLQPIEVYASRGQGTAEAYAGTDGLWPAALIGTYLAGVLIFILRYALSQMRLCMLLRGCRREALSRYLPGAPTHVELLVSPRRISPFSWMNHIVISEEDLAEGARQILTHELAHCNARHSWDVLLADACVTLQWFNPAAWLTRQELRNIHEYEADEAVIHSGIDATEYQLLLIKKAVGPKLFAMSVANSLNHSNLKKRITMMMRSKSNAWARAKYLYVVPVAAMALTAFAHTGNEVSATWPAAAGSDKVMEFGAKAEMNQPESSAWAINGVKDDVLEVCDEMPQFPGGFNELFKFLSDNMKYPDEAIKAKTEGRVTVSFVVEKDGSIGQTTVLKGVDQLLDAEALRVVNAMPKWIPGKDKGKPVRVRYTLPINFSAE